MVGNASRLSIMLFLAAMPRAVSAFEPVAIVQAVGASHTSVRKMEMIARGRVFDLGVDGRLVLGYLRSCIHEEITGGHVTVGAEQSRVEGGRVLRRRVECDGRALDLTRGQASESSVLIFRRPPSEPRRLNIHHTSPVIRVPGATGNVRIDRLDQPSPPLTIHLNEGLADLAENEIRLAPRGLYKLTSGERSVVVRVDSAARGGDGGQTVGRLISF